MRLLPRLALAAAGVLAAGAIALGVTLGAAAPTERGTDTVAGSTMRKGNGNGSGNGDVVRPLGHYWS